MHYTSAFSQLLSILCLLPICFSPAGAIDQPLPGEVEGDIEIISFSPATDSDSKPSLTVKDESESGLSLEFSLPSLGFQALDIDGQIYHAIEIENGAFRGTEGEPMLPTFSRFLQIPDEAGISYEITVEETTELTGYTPLPMQPGDDSAFIISEEAYTRTSFTDAPIVEIGAPAIARDLRLVPITISPVRYNPSLGKLEVTSKITVRVSYDGVDLRNATAPDHQTIPKSFDNLYRNTVVNYCGPRDNQSVGLGTYVIICPDDFLVLQKLEPLVEWRTRKGYDVHVATTSETGNSTTSIKNWIQAAYDNWDNPPEFITLIGDTESFPSLPCWTENYTGYHGETDHFYVMLSGDDILPDAHIGRISVSTVDELELYVHKIVSYETTPDMSSTSWFRRACVTGDPGASGYTTIQLMQWLKTRCLEHQYSSVDTIFTSPFVSQMVSSLNQGDTVFCYRGYLGMSGFGTGHITNLQNGAKMPFAVILTCDSGSFAHGYARSEAFMRAGAPPNLPTGGIASVGTATTGTHTRYNNCVTYGIWQSIFGDDMPYFGHSLTRGKYELYLNYSQHDSGAVNTFSSWNNLMGDPAGEMWTSVPVQITATCPVQIALGSNMITVDANTGYFDCADAYVCLWKEGEIHTGAYTDRYGLVDIPLDPFTEGEIKLTITKHNHLPFTATITVAQEDCFVGYSAHQIDGDAAANPNESIALQVEVENYGTKSASSVSGSITTTDPYITITDSSEEFGTIPGGATAWSAGDFNLQLAPETPNGHLVQLDLVNHSGDTDWFSLIQFPVLAGEFVFHELIIQAADNQLDPGESVHMSVKIHNQGAVAGTSVTGTLSTTSSWVQVTDAIGTFGTINPGETYENIFNLFGVSALAECYPGHLADMQLILEFSGGVIDTVLFLLPVGSAASSDPTGPDAYGYYAFDNTDAGYDEAPGFWWVEIAPNYGGAGTSVGLTDFGTAQDDSRIVDLPFPFTYYGESFTKATICSNGWIAMGETYLTNYRNWQIPCVGAPPNIIAPMWDNFYQEGDSQVYHYYNPVSHTYIIEWSRLRNNYGNNAISTFQVLLYDPAYYPTDTGDGIILFQYQTYNNTDQLQHYSTTGIQNATNTTGLLYNYWNSGNAGAAPIGTGTAVKFLPVATFDSGTLSGHVVNASNGNADLPDALIRLLETGQTFTSDENGEFSSLVMTGTYTVEVSHPGFDLVTIEDVEINTDQTTSLTIPLTDILAPIFSNTTVYPNTDNPNGPYDIYSNVTEYSSFQELSLYYNNDGGWLSTPMVSQGEDLYLASIPGSASVIVQYYLYGHDTGGNESFDPSAGQSDPYSFWVLTPLLKENMEDGALNWNHEVGSAGYSDQWHLSTARNHTPIGIYAWKFGDVSGGNYADMTDGVLITPAVELDCDATLTFWHWLSAEASGANPGFAYDGGFLEISVDGGEWTQIFPELDYTHQIMVGSGPGPYPADTPVYSGDIDWTEASFRLEGYRGEVRIRFRFGSDGGVNSEGWYIDDVKIIPDTPDLSETPEQETLPVSVILYQNHPNPFRLTSRITQIRFELPEPARVGLNIFDTSGRLVRKLHGGLIGAGRHAVDWDGRDWSDQPVGSGVYFYVLKTDNTSQSKQMLILR